jgi:hypothetical protein
MDINQAELMAHPLMAKVTADIAETRAKQASDRLVQAAEQQQLWAEQGLYLAEQFKSAVAEYERLRVEAHAAVGLVWATVQEYSRVTGQPPQNFPERTFNEINLPTLIPNPSPWAPLSSGFTTTQAAVMGWFNPTTHRKQWQ